ncbi:MAG: tryptophan--tRNA ligase [Pelagibacterales bacterium]|nr:tryptophan--tRNA ligase [Pelagibacterales bacterium]
MKTVFSGIQPTGNLHLGNYLGSIRNWIDLQDKHNCIFGVMNLHAITLPQDPKALQQNVLDAAAVYLACGLNPKKSTIFVQSDVAEHVEMAWILGTLTPLGWLNRMTQFKEKTKQKTVQVMQGLSRVNQVVQDESANLGLYSYPVLMASDILLYKADLVPVGEDQKQHLELTRDIAGAFNRRFKNEYFKLPEPMILKEVKRIMSLQDGNKKMSKSDESDLSRINLNDSSDLILKKIKKAKTDSQATITYDENRPEIYNLLNIFATFANKDPQLIAAEYETAGNGKFKTDLAELLVEKLRPIQENLSNFKKDQSYIKQVLRDGKLKAQEIAVNTRREVFEIVGL